MGRQGRRLSNEFGVYCSKPFSSFGGDGWNAFNILLKTETVIPWTLDRTWMPRGKQEETRSPGGSQEIITNQT